MSRTLRSTVALVLVVGLFVLVPVGANADPPVGEWTVLSPVVPEVAASPHARQWFADVSCPIVDFCMAVGDAADNPSGYGFSLIEVWDGTSWSVVPSPETGAEAGDQVDAVSCGTPTFCAVAISEFEDADIFNRIWFWDGSSWIEQDLSAILEYPEEQIDIDCASDGSCLALTQFGTYAVWDGAQWAGPHIQAEWWGSGPSCVSAHWCAFTEQAGLAQHWDGESGTTVPVGAANGLQFAGESIDCVSFGFCVSVGKLYDFSAPGGAPITATASWDGTSWWATPFEVDPSVHLASVSCPATNSCVAVGTNDATHWDPVAQRSAFVWDGVGWHAVPDAPGGAETIYEQIACANASCLAVGRNGAGASQRVVAARFDVGGTPQMVSVGDVVVTESSQRGAWVAASFPLTLSTPAAEDWVVDFETHAGSASAGPDFQAASGQVTIPAGASQGAITVWVKGDAFYEGSGGYLTPGAEYFEVELTGVTAEGGVVGRSFGRGTIRDSEPDISMGDLTIVEPDIGSARGWVTVSLDSPAASPVQVQYTTFNHGAAVAGVDYLTRSGTVTIPTGKAYTRIPVWVRGDTAPEPDETFGVMVTDAVGGEVPDGLAEITIAADE